MLDHRDGHIDRLVRQRMWALWLLHCGETRQKTAEILQVSRATVQRHVEAYRTGGLSRLARRGEAGSREGMDDVRRATEGRVSRATRPLGGRGGRAHQDADRLGAATDSSPTPPASVGAGVSSDARDPGTAQKKLEEHLADQAAFVEHKRQPALDAAQPGRGHVFFVDASHFVTGTFLCGLWCVTRVFVKAAAGRQRLNVLGAWNAVTHELVSVLNAATVNADTMCELLRKIAALGLAGPHPEGTRLVLGNAKYQHAAAVKALATEWGLHLEFLPGDSPNLNLIERLGKFLKRRALYGRYHPDFASFRTAIETEIEQLSTTHQPAIASLRTLNFQTFTNVSLLSA